MLLVSELAGVPLICRQKKRFTFKFGCRPEKMAGRASESHLVQVASAELTWTRRTVTVPVTPQAGDTGSDSASSLFPLSTGNAPLLAPPTHHDLPEILNPLPAPWQCCGAGQVCATSPTPGGGFEGRQALKQRLYHY